MRGRRKSQKEEEEEEEKKLVLPSPKSLGGYAVFPSLMHERPLPIERSVLSTIPSKDSERIAP